MDRTLNLPDISRRALLAGSAATASASLLHGCGEPATAQNGGIEAAVAELARLDPLRPEDFGAAGRGGNETRALEGLLAEARRRGRARIVLRPGATYAATNPFLWGGVRELLIEGNGASIVTAHPAVVSGVSDANFAPFRSPTAILPNGTEPLDFGPRQGAGAADLGIRLRSAAKGATTLASRDGTPLPAGPLIVYGWDRFGLDGMPPSPMCWEWVDAMPADGTRDRVRLSKPLRYAYDELAPEYAYKNAPGLRYGAARALPLTRRAGRFRELPAQQLLVLRDVRFPRSPRLRGPGSEFVNGVPGFGGARHIVLERIFAHQMFVNCAETVAIRDSTVTGDLEIDKLLGDVVIERTTAAALVGAIGARTVRLGPGTKVTGGTWLAPTEMLSAKGASFAGDKGSQRALIGFYAHGSRAVRLDGCTFEANHPDVERFFESPFFTARFRRVGASQLALGRAEYDSSGIFRNLFVGAVFYDERNRPVARVTRLPWCPDGDLVRGDLRIGIEPLAALSAAPTLRLPVIADLTIAGARVTGPQAGRVSTLFGTANNRAAASELAVASGLELGATAIRLNSDITALDRPRHSFLTVLGRSFLPATVRFEVVRAAPRGTPNLLVAADTDDGRDVALLAGAELSRTGVTTVDAAAIVRGAGILSVRVNDPSRGLPASGRARWSLTVEGRFR